MTAVLAKCCGTYSGGYSPMWKEPIGMLGVIIQLMTITNESIGSGHVVSLGVFFISS